jgi:[protein-PII] uridylyltransferase
LSDSVDQTLSARSSAVEERVRLAYAAALEPHFPSGLTLVSVGGFGRRELFPYSDVDLLILIDSAISTASVKEHLSVFLQSLWDSGLRPSQSVHTVADCVIEQEQNAELTISLLDRRWLAGDAGLFETLDQKFRTFLDRRGEAVARQLAGLAVARRAKFQNAIYHLEPNVKDTPGARRSAGARSGLRFSRLPAHPPA